MPADGRPFSLSRASDLDETSKVAGNVVAVNGDGDGYELVEQTGGSGGGADLSDDAPEDLGASAGPGVSAEASRSDHVHVLPSAADVGAAAEVHTHSGADITSGTVADARIAATIARDSEVTAAVAAEATARDSAIATHSADETGVHGIADTSELLDTANVGVTVQAHDDDLDAIAALTPTNDDILQRKAGAWANRTIAQLLTDLGLAALYQAKDATLDTYAGIDPSANVQAVLGAADYAAIRTLLGLVIGTNVQAYDADLDTWAGLTPSSFFQTLVDDADAATARATLGVIASLFENGGGQEISVAGLSGELADDQPTSASKIDSGAATDGQVLTADGSGGSGWEDATGGGGSTTGEEETIVLALELFA